MEATSQAGGTDEARGPQVPTLTDVGAVKLPPTPEPVVPSAAPAYRPPRAEELAELGTDFSTLLSEASKSFFAAPATVVTAWLTSSVSSLLLPFFGVTYRLESLLGVLGKLGEVDTDVVARVAVPTKTRAAYSRGFWSVFGSALRTDLTVGALLLLTLVFAAIPLGLLWSVCSQLFAALSLKASLPFFVPFLSYAPLACAAVMVLGWLTVLVTLHARLLAHVPERSVNSSVHTRLFSLARLVMRRNRGLVWLAAAAPAVLGLGVGLVSGGLAAVAVKFLPSTANFLAIGLGLPLVLALAGFSLMLAAHVSQALANAVSPEQAASTANASTSLADRALATLGRWWVALTGERRARIFGVAMGAAAALVLLSAFARGLANVTLPHLGVLVTLVAACTVLSLSRRAGEKS